MELEGQQRIERNPIITIELLRRGRFGCVFGDDNLIRVLLLPQWRWR
jgi:hypothetical protein